MVFAAQMSCASPARSITPPLIATRIFIVKQEINTVTLPVSSACQRSLAIVQAFWYNGEKEDRREEEWNSGNRITGETW